MNSPHMLHKHYNNPQLRTIEMAKSKESIDLCYDLGGKRIRFFGNDIPEDINAQKIVSYVSDCVIELAEYSKPLGIDILLEMHGQFNYWGYVLPAIENALKTVDNVGILFNCDMRDLVGGSMKPTFERVKKYVKHVHMHNVESGYPYLELFEELYLMGYEGYVSAEADSSSDPFRVLCVQNEAVRALIKLAKFTAK